MVKNIRSTQKMFGLLPIQRYALMFIILALFSAVNADGTGSRNRKANKLYSKDQYEEALKLYEDALAIDPANGKLMMNRGSTLYRLDEFDEAEKSYQDALPRLPPKDKKALADAHYNLGNINYKQGEQLESSGNVSSARGKYSQALENYINTLKLRPDDKDAKWNLQLAHQKVDMLENQQDQQQQNQDKQEDGDKKQKDQQGDKDDKKDQDKKDDQSNKDDQKQDQQDQQQQPQDQEEQDMKKEEAERMIEQYADDADTLNKPRFLRGKIRQPEKDW